MTAAPCDALSADPKHPSRCSAAVGLLVGLALLAVALLHLRNVFSAWWDHDEVEHLHAAWLVAQGLAPFRDFFEAHQPPFWYALAPLAARVSAAEMVSFARLAMLPLMALTVLLAWRLGRHVAGPGRAAALGALLLPATWVYLRTALEVRPDGVQVFLEILALERFASWAARPRWTSALAAGLSAGLSVAFLHKGIAVLPGLAAGAAAVVVARPGEARRLLAHASLAVAGAAAPVAAMYAAMAVAGWLPDYWFYSVRFMAAIQTATDLDLHFGPGLVVAVTFLDSPAIFLGGGAGAIMAFGRWRDPVRLAVLVTLLATVGLLLLSRMPFKQFFLPMWPLLAILAAEAFRWVERRAGASPLGVVGPVVVAASLALTAVQQLSNPTNGQQRAVTARIREVTTQGDAVMVSPPWHPIDRPDAGHLWFNIGPFLAALDQMEARGEDLGPYGGRMRDILARTPRAVLLDPQLRDVVPLERLSAAGLVPDQVLEGLWVCPENDPPARFRAP